MSEADQEGRANWPGRRWHDRYEASIRRERDMSDTTTKPVPRDKPHWYRWYFGNCPVCGCDKSYRVRVAGKRPKSPARRYVTMSDRECYDNCLG